MKCCSPKNQERMEAFLFSRLGGTEMKQFEDHLFECALCRRSFLEECVLRELTRKHRKHLFSEAMEPVLWRRLRDMLESVAAACQAPAFPVQFRRESSSLVTRPELFMVNLSGSNEICTGDPVPDLEQDRLFVRGFSPESMEHEVYLMICSKQELMNLRPDHSQRIQSIIDHIAAQLVFRKEIDESVTRVINRSFVLKGTFHRTQNGSMHAEIVLSPVAIAYLNKPDYTPVLIIR